MRALLLNSAQILQIRAQTGDRQEKFGPEGERARPRTRLLMVFDSQNR